MNSTPISDRKERRLRKWEHAGESFILPVRFKPQQFLGSGTYGIVWECFDKTRYNLFLSCPIDTHSHVYTNSYHNLPISCHFHLYELLSISVTSPPCNAFSSFSSRCQGDKPWRSKSAKMSLIHAHWPREPCVR